MIPHVYIITIIHKEYQTWRSASYFFYDNNIKNTIMNVNYFSTKCKIICTEQQFTWISLNFPITLHEIRG